MKLIHIVGISAASFLLALGGMFAFTLYEANLYQGRVGRSLSHDLGFTPGSPYVHFGDSSREVFTLHPLPGGVLATSGVRDGDIPWGFSITGFYKHLHRNRGSQVTIRLMDGGSGPPKDQRAIRFVSFYIPPAK
jgi:hypothetical protein